MENSAALPQKNLKIECRVAQQSHVWACTYKNRKQALEQIFVHCGVIRKDQKVETT